MNVIAVLGAGELGAGLARRLAERELARAIFLVDDDLGLAQGKALDITQSGPVEGFDVHIEGVSDLAAVPPPDAAILADPSSLRVPAETRPGPGRFKDLRSILKDAFVLIAGPDGAAQVDAAVDGGFRRERVLGTAPLAVAGALRRWTAEEVRSGPTGVALIPMGLPPDPMLIPRETATVGGCPIDRSFPLALRRARDRVRTRWSPGPIALAAAAVEALFMLSGRGNSLPPAFARLSGEYGHRGISLSVPVRLGPTGVEVVEIPLDPVDRIVFDNAADQRRVGRG